MTARNLFGRRRCILSTHDLPSAASCDRFPIWSIVGQRILLLNLFVACWLAMPFTLNAFAQHAVVIRPHAWRDAVSQWKQYRERQGTRVFELDAEAGADNLLNSIKHLAKHEKVGFVVLAGSVAWPADIPTFYHQSTALVQHGGSPQLAGDSRYGDLDDDGLPELAVGRIPARSSQQLQQCLEQTIQFETSKDFSACRRDVHVVAGIGGFGALTDTMVEAVSRRFLTERFPGWINLSMTQANLSSPFCPDPWQLSRTCIDGINRGGLFWVYVGHGWVDQLDDFRLGDQSVPILSKSDLDKIACQLPPIAVFLACYTGAIDALEPSLAEDLVLRRDGPIAALAASRVSGPYGLAILSDGLLKACFEKRCGTLGEVVLSAKRAMRDEIPLQAGMLADRQLASIHAMAKLMNPKDYDLTAERMEHVWQMNLLGDPLLRICHPGSIEIESISTSVAPGSELTIAGKTSDSGDLQIELVHRRGQTARTMKASILQWQSDEGRQAYSERYLQANEQTIISKSLGIAAGAFTSRLLLPSDLADGIYGIRLFLQSQSGWYTAFREIQVPSEQLSP
jgi:hypothetical protein